MLDVDYFHQSHHKKMFDGMVLLCLYLYRQAKDFNFTAGT
jgi:hypothetical protein